MALFQLNEINDFFKEADFKEIIQSPEISIKKTQDDRELFKELFRHDYKIIEFPGCTTDYKKYIKQHHSEHKLKHTHTACEGMGVVLRLKSPKTATIKILQDFLNSPELEGAVEKAARAIVRVSKSDAEEMLLQLLEWEHISAIAVELLARVGTVQAVEHLLPLADAWLTKPRRRAAAKAAIQAIQARLGDVDEGRLSVAPVEDEGGLSVAANRSSPLNNG